MTATTIVQQPLPPETGTAFALRSGPQEQAVPGETRYEAPQSWLRILLPLGPEKSTSQACEVQWVRPGRGFTPRTALGKRLWELRQQAIGQGTSLLAEEEILEEVKKRRGERLHGPADLS